MIIFNIAIFFSYWLFILKLEISGRKMGNWKLNDIRWDDFDRSLLDPEIVTVVKAASMVEYHSKDYAEYLCSVFAGDTEFCNAAVEWGQEEIQHGKALRQYAELADPNFDFDSTFDRFVSNHDIQTDANESIRGSRCSELVARCIVEVGTSAYYSALRDSTSEPVLRQICKNIAADEFRHYKLFYSTMKKYQKSEKVGFISRLITATSRLAEAQDDELGYAYYCASGSTDPYVRSENINAYAKRVFPLYRYEHVKRGLGMTMKAVGVKPQSHVGKVVTFVGWSAFQRYARHLEKKAA
tara:strand:+ start:1534 stop:2424 length:891 start_codon:yes stop_codon:yes gene_type:complete